MALQEEFEKQGNWLFRYRGILPLIILVAGTAVYIHTKLQPRTFSHKYLIGMYECICLVVSLAGLCIRAYTVGHTPSNTSGRNTCEGQVADTLNTTGIYSILRHPLYLGNFLMWFGICLLTENIWFIVIFCSVFWLYYERIMYCEEQFLRRKFGSDYTEWANKTPAFLPEFKLFVKPSFPFSWKKVLQNEKNGLLALFLIFAAFDFIDVWINSRVLYYNYFYITMCIACIVFYCTMKFRKRIKSSAGNLVLNFPPPPPQPDNQRIMLYD